MDQLRNYLTNHTPPALQQAQDQSGSTRGFSQSFDKLVRQHPLRFRVDTAVLDRLSDTLDAALVIPDPPPDLSVPHLEILDKIHSLNAASVIVRTEVRDLYPFFQHYLFAIWTVLLPMIGIPIDIDLVAWRLTGNLPKSGDFSLFIQDMCFFLLEVKRPVVLPSADFSSAIRVILASPNSEIEVTRSADFAYRYPTEITPKLFSAVSQLVDDMHTKRVAYGILTTYDDYILVRREASDLFSLSQVIRRVRPRVPPTLNLPSPSPTVVHRMTPIQLLLSLPLIGRSASSTWTTFIPPPESHVHPPPSAKKKRKRGVGMRGDTATGQEIATGEESGTGDGFGEVEGGQDEVDSDDTPSLSSEGSSDREPRGPFTPLKPIQIVKMEGPQWQKSKGYQTESLSLILEEIISSNDNSTVYRALVPASTPNADGAHQVVAKFFKSRPELSSLQSAKRERDIYITLKSLWGLCVPKFWGMYTHRGQTVLVMDYAGRAVSMDWSILPMADQQRIRSVYESIHSLGVVHLDVSPRHVTRVKGTDQFMLIDFGESRNVDVVGDEYLEREKREIDRMLMSNPEVWDD